MLKDYDVLIVGAGPAGLALAASLQGSGLKIAQIDPASRAQLENPAFDGREIALTHPSKALLENLGFWQQLPPDEIHLLKAASVVNGESPFRLHFPLPSQNSRGQRIDTLGYLVSNHLIRQSAFAVVSQQENVEFYLERKALSCGANDDIAWVQLDDGTRLTGKILIAADSRFSTIRKQMGISADTHEFGRSVIVFRLKHSLPNDHTARECFFYGSTLALLPLHDHQTNCVVTLDSKHAPELLQKSPTELASWIEAQIQHELGTMELSSTIHHYPLVGVHARRFYAQRTALVGDAACGMHPVTAHGYNLGLEGQAILAQLILRYAAQGKDIGQSALLREYDRRHQQNTRLLYHGTNAIVKLFTAESHATKALRHGVLRVAQSLPPLKRLISQQLTG